MCEILIIIVLQIFIDRLILALISVSIRIPGGLDEYLKIAFQMIRGDCNANLCLGLGMLKPLPEEILCADIDTSLRQNLEDRMLTASSTVFCELNRLCSHSSNENKLCVALLSTLQFWLAQGLSLTRLYSDYPQLFSFICLCVNSAEEYNLLRVSLVVLHEIVIVSEYPRTELRNIVVMQIVDLWTANEDFLFGI